MLKFIIIYRFIVNSDDNVVLFILIEYQCGNMTIVKTDLPSNDIWFTNTTNFSMCCSACRNTTGCLSFTWISGPGMFFGMCYLKWSSGGGNNNRSIDHVSAYY